MGALYQVRLLETPLALRIGYDSEGMCLPISRPILLAAKQAQRGGQTWILYKPTKTGDLQPIQAEEVLSYVVPKSKAWHPVSFQTQCKRLMSLLFLFKAT